uniref:RHS repeat domain-containing protein n=2 Tax=Prevotella heparinolytica TaxID=28113 RepID=UPI0035A18D5E
AGPLGVFAVVESIGTHTQLYYVYKDHLGSWTTVTDGEGNVEQSNSFDAWGNPRDPETWSGNTTSSPMFDRDFTGHEHLYGFGLINMNGRMYDPVMSGFLSSDNYVQAPDFSQSFNRYAYCLNNPLKYVDPDGEEFITAAIIIGGVIIGAYTGGALANGGNYNITQWNWDMGTTIGILGGGIVGGLSSWAGLAVAGTGFAFCNTTAIAASSLAYSTGMYATGQLAGFDYDISMSIGVASYNFTKGEFGYLFKKGNTVLENIGYGFGALSNLSDIYRFVTWDVLSKEKKLEVLRQTIGDENVKVEYDKTLSADAQYNKETQTITIGPKGLNRGRGWAQSTLQHEYKHYLDITNGAGNTSNDILDWYAYCKELHNAEKNGLTISQHYELVKRATDCGNNIGVSIGRLPKYTLKEWIRSFMYWF